MIGSAPQASERKDPSTKEDVSEKLEQAKKENVQKEMKAFVGNETINGVEISVLWPKNNIAADGYEIYLPGVDDVSKQVIRINQDPEIAKLVFNYARMLAKRESDANKVHEEIRTMIDRIA